MTMDEWVSDVNSADDTGGSSLFQDNFRRMVANEEVDSLNAQTVQSQVDQIDDKELLADAVEVDDRDDCVAAYKERLGELNADDLDDDADEEEEEEEADEVDEADEEDADEPADPSDEPDEPNSEVTDEPDDEPEADADDATGWELDDADEETGDSPVTDEAAEEIEAAAEATVDEADADTIDEAAEEVMNDVQDDVQDTPDPTEVDSDETDDEPVDTGGAEVSVSETETDDDSEMPIVDVGSIAPNAQSRAEVAEAESQHTLLVWGPEGSGKSHIAHSAPEPVCYIDTEGKADELADKFDKHLYYWTPDDYQEAKEAMERALDVLAEYREQGVTGTIVVDSMTVMWEWAKIDYAKFAYQTDDLTEVSFQSELEGEQDWAKIKARHNDAFRAVILDSPYHAVFTSGQKEDFNAVMEGADGKPMTDDGEKRNRYAVKDVVRTRVDDEGDMVADLRKAAKTKYSFIGLKWPEWTDIYGAIDRIADAEQAAESVDVTQWDFDVVEGQPVSEGSDDNGGDDGN